MLKKYLSHPLTRDLTLDDPLLMESRRRIIKEKSFLKRIYMDWYKDIVEDIPSGDEVVLELGSGSAFLKEFIPDIVTSDIVPLSNADIIADGSAIPFADGSLRAIVMTDVFHHLPNARNFFREANRCLKHGGIIIMIEPWVTRWSRYVYKYLHHEPFEPDAEDWEFSEIGPLSGANSALPWLVFERDRMKFEAEYPSLKIETIKPMMPFTYLLSGGVSLRSLVPGCFYGLCRSFENMFKPWMSSLAMFAKIKVSKVYPSHEHI